MREAELRRKHRLAEREAIEHGRKSRVLEETAATLAEPVASVEDASATVSD